jgi:hypothetical protein
MSKPMTTQCDVCNERISEGYGRWLGSCRLICKSCVLASPELIALLTPKDRKALKNELDGGQSGVKKKRGNNE